MSLNSCGDREDTLSRVPICISGKSISTLPVTPLGSLCKLWCPAVPRASTVVGSLMARRDEVGVLVPAGPE